MLFIHIITIRYFQNKENVKLNEMGKKKEEQIRTRLQSSIPNLSTNNINSDLFIRAFNTCM